MDDVAAPVRKNKTLGIASFVLAVVLLFVFAALVASEIYLEHERGTTRASDALEIGDMLILLLDLVAIGLGIAGLLDKTSKKILPVLGICIALVPPIVAGGVVVYLFSEPATPRASDPAVSIPP